MKSPASSVHVRSPKRVELRPRCWTWRLRTLDAAPVGLVKMVAGFEVGATISQLRRQIRFREAWKLARSRASITKGPMVETATSFQYASRSARVYPAVENVSTRCMVPPHIDT